MRYFKTEFGIEVEHDAESCKIRLGNGELECDAEGSLLGEGWKYFVWYDDSISRCKAIGTGERFYRDLREWAEAPASYTITDYERSGAKEITESEAFERLGIEQECEHVWSLALPGVSEPRCNKCGLGRDTRTYIELGAEPENDEIPLPDFKTVGQCTVNVEQSETEWRYFLSPHGDIINRTNGKSEQCATTHSPAWTDVYIEDRWAVSRFEEHSYKEITEAEAFERLGIKPPHTADAMDIPGKLDPVEGGGVDFNYCMKRRDEECAGRTLAQKNFDETPEKWYCNIDYGVWGWK